MRVEVLRRALIERRQLSDGRDPLLRQHRRDLRPQPLDLGHRRVARRRSDRRGRFRLRLYGRRGIQRRGGGDRLIGERRGFLGRGLRRCGSDLRQIRERRWWRRHRRRDRRGLDRLSRLRLAPRRRDRHACSIFVADRAIGCMRPGHPLLLDPLGIPARGPLARADAHGDDGHHHADADQRQHDADQGIVHQGGLHDTLRYAERQALGTPHGSRNGAGTMPILWRPVPGPPSSRT